MSIAPSTIERLVVAQRISESERLGRRRRAADRALRVLSRRCNECAGYGCRLVGWSWQTCAVCEGRGQIATSSS